MPGAAQNGVPSDPILRLALAVLRSGRALPEALDELRDRSRAEVRAARDLVRSWTDPGAPSGGNGAIGPDWPPSAPRHDAGAAPEGER
jgi:TPP-dependent pyruvate/acetoin dehydrogenase alpha subunit